MYSHRGGPEDLAAGLAACSANACKTSLRRRQQKNASRLARKRELRGEGYQEEQKELAKARDRAAASEAVVATLMAAVAAATTAEAGLPALFVEVPRPPKRARLASPVAAADAEIDKQRAAPDDYFCPITQELMVDPVICADGHTYERTAIAAWLETHTTSPKTNLELEAPHLIPNIALRNAIAFYREANPDIKD